MATVHVTSGNRYQLVIGYLLLICGYSLAAYLTPVSHNNLQADPLNEWIGDLDGVSDLFWIAIYGIYLFFVSIFNFALTFQAYNQQLFSVWSILIFFLASTCLLLVAIRKQAILWVKIAAWFGLFVSLQPLALYIYQNL